MRNNVQKVQCRHSKQLIARGRAKLDFFLLELGAPEISMVWVQAKIQYEICGTNQVRLEDSVTHQRCLAQAGSLSLSLTLCHRKAQQASILHQFQVVAVGGV
jgi:hypothetical protein